MSLSRNLRSQLLVAAVVTLGLGSFANYSQAATQQYLDNNGATSGFGIVNNATYSWESNLWSTSTTGVLATGPYTNDGTGFARFYGATSGNSYTVTVGITERTVGMYLNQAGVTLTINQAPSTSGGLTVEGGALQGFLVNGTALIINAPISGNGGIEEESTGALYLYGNNSYTFGTETSNGQSLYYNNNNSFGIGPFTFIGTGTSGIISNVAGLTIANPMKFGAAVTTTNFASNLTGTTATWSGGMTLPTTAGTTTILGGLAGNTTVFSGAITGASTDALAFGNAANPGTIVLSSAANTYTGTTTLTAGTLTLGAANAIASSPKLILAGGTLNPDAINQIMASTTFALTASSTLDYSTGASELDFANSSALAWTGTLNLTGWNPSVDHLRFGTSSTGLTSAQLADIEFNGAGLGTASLDASGYVVVPEPASLSLLALASTTLLARKRRA